MKLKLPVTEKFLWNVYSIVEGLGYADEILGRRSPGEIFCPETRLMRYETRRKMGKRKFSQLIYRLKKSGFIRAPDWDPKAGIIVTQKGMEKIFRAKLKLQEKKRREDKKWEMVVFDIEEKKRKARNIVRYYLKTLGYKKFQQSIWISPFDVLKETQALIRKYDLENEIKIFIVEKP